MICESEGHFGTEEARNQPKYQCIYCGSWSYLPQWTTEELESFLNCPCDHDFDGHLLLCED